MQVPAPFEYQRASTVKDAIGSAGNPIYAGDLAADGYIQISLDGRGTPAPKGAAWRKCIYRKIGDINRTGAAAATRQSGREREGCQR